MSKVPADLLRQGTVAGARISERKGVCGTGKLPAASDLGEQDN